MAMRKRRIIVILVVALFFLLIVAGQFTGRIPSGAVLQMVIAGPVAEEDWSDLNARLMEGEVTVFRELLEALDRAQQDDRIRGVSLEVHSVGMNFGKVQELRTKLTEFVDSGKFCTAYLEQGTNLAYYLASACPEIYLTPTGTLWLTGLLAHTTFVRGTLDKLHIYPDMYNTGKYKTATNLLTEKKMTPAHREVVTAMLTEWQAQMVEGIAAGRKLDATEVEAMVRQGPYLDEEAVERELVDQILYYDQYRDLLKEKTGRSELETIDVPSYLEQTAGPSGPKIALVYATGDIVTGESGYNPAVGRMLGSSTLAAALRAAREDSSIQAVVLRVDSPGGDAVASEVIRREVQLAREKKPVVVSMSDVAASGGYWIAMSANRVVADPGTLTGSIGVIFGKLNVKGLYELMGMTSEYVALAPNATLLYPFENFTPEQQKFVRRFLNDTYEDFLRGVSEGREIPYEEVARIAQGRVWLGSQAQELGLVDELGGLDRAVSVAKELAHIPAERQAQYVIFPQPKGTWEQLTELLAVKAGLLSAPRAWMDPHRHPYRNTSILALMPFELEVR